MKKASSSFLPSDAETLITEAMCEDMPKNPVEDKLEKILMACPKGSRGKIVMRGVVFGDFGGVSGTEIIARDVICTDRLKRMETYSSSEEKMEQTEEQLVLRLAVSQRRTKSKHLHARWIELIVNTTL